MTTVKQKVAKKILRENASLGGVLKSYSWKAGV